MQCQHPNPKKTHPKSRDEGLPAIYQWVWEDAELCKGAALAVTSSVQRTDEIHTMIFSKNDS